MASASQDRFVRLHSTFGPPAEAGQHQEQKGAVLERLYVKVTPTVVVWDDLLEPELEKTLSNVGDEEGEEGVDDVWDAMEEVDSDSDSDEKIRRRKEKKTRAA